MEVTPLIAYLSGGMENAQNEGADWRSDMTNWLRETLGMTRLIQYMNRKN